MSSPPAPGEHPFDRFAAEYDEALARGISVSGEDKEYFARGRVAWLSRYRAEPLPRPRTVLDFGCGTGTATPYLLGLEGAERLVGVDLSEESIQVARQRHPTARASFLSLGEFEPRGDCDLAFCNGVFHHIPTDQRAAAIDLIYQALAPGGVFAFWENNPWNPGTRYVMSRIPFDRDAVLLWPRGARALLRTGGFEVLGTDFLFVFPRFLAPLRRLEPALSRWPLGAQYLVLCRKR